MHIHKDKGNDGKTYTNAFVNASNVRFLGFDSDSQGKKSSDETPGDDL
ncbi:MAG: hypothetical protein ACOCQA_02865 [bacterium]